ncbi:MAG: hypothetical protein EAX95_01375 [Candidatus Thorarchaeota archaeon]|nr:hypothetical protein [Candidatus Thorarchaeota archaeon]
MKAQEVLRLSFERVAGHFANLEQIQMLVGKISGEEGSIEDIIQKIEGMIHDAEVTLKTDLRILVNEIRHQIRKSSG